MLEGFAQHAAVAPADDQHALGVSVRHDRHMGDHLVIAELVLLGGLDDAVEHQYAAEQRVAKHDRLLKGGSPFEKDFLAQQ